MASSTMDAAQALLTALDTSMSRQWREEDRRWRAEDREWRADDVAYREHEERRWFREEAAMRDAERQWRAEDIEQRHVDNARYLWARFVEKNRRDVEEKSEQLKAISNLTALFAGFAVVCLTQFPVALDSAPLWLIAVYGILTATTVCLHAIAMVLCTLILGSILKNGKSYVDEAAEEEFMLHCRRFVFCFQPGDRPPVPRRTFEAFWEFRCEDDWRNAFRCFTWGVLSFLLSLIPIAWIKFNFSTVIPACFTAIVVVAIVLWSWQQLSWGAYLTTTGRYSRQRKSRNAAALLDIAEGLRPQVPLSTLPFAWHIAPTRTGAEAPASAHGRAGRHSQSHAHAHPHHQRSSSYGTPTDSSSDDGGEEARSGVGSRGPSFIGPRLRLGSSSLGVSGWSWRSNSSHFGRGPGISGNGSSSSQRAPGRYSWKDSSFSVAVAAASARAGIDLPSSVASPVGRSAASPSVVGSGAGTTPRPTADAASAGGPQSLGPTPPLSGAVAEAPGDAAASSPLERGTARPPRPPASLGAEGVTAAQVGTEQGSPRAPESLQDAQTQPQQQLQQHEQPNEGRQQHQERRQQQQQQQQQQQRWQGQSQQLPAHARRTPSLRAYGSRRGRLRWLHGDRQHDENSARTSSSRRLGHHSNPGALRDRSSASLQEDNIEGSPSGRQHDNARNGRNDDVISRSNADSDGDSTSSDEWGLAAAVVLGDDMGPLQPPLQTMRRSSSVPSRSERAALLRQASGSFRQQQQQMAELLSDDPLLGLQ